MTQQGQYTRRYFPKGTRVQWWIKSSVPQIATVVRAEKGRDMTFIRTENGSERWAYNEDLSREGE